MFGVKYLLAGGKLQNEVKCSVSAGQSPNPQRPEGQSNALKPLHALGRAARHGGTGQRLGGQRGPGALGAQTAQPGVECPQTALRGDNPTANIP